MIQRHTIGGTINTFAHSALCYSAAQCVFLERLPYNAEYGSGVFKLSLATFPEKNFLCLLYTDFNQCINTIGIRIITN